PRVFVRAAFRPVPMLGLGLHAGVWFPSELAPSVTPGAITPEFMAFGSIHLRVPLVLTLSAGYRVDRSAAAVPDAASWSAADRVAGGINAFHAVLLGAGGAYRVGAVEILAEWTWDLLVGDRAPSPEYSPMHVRAGLRWQPMPLRRLFASLVLDGTLSARPSVAADAPLVSIDPRVGAFLTLAIGIPFAQPSVTSTRASVSSSAAPPVAAAAETTARAALEGRVLAEDGTPVAGAVVRATPANGAPVEVTTDEQGHYGLDGLPPGTYDLSISAARRPEVHHSVTVVAGQHGTQDAALDRPFPAGQIRGLVRSFDGTPVVATIEIERIHLRQQTDARGEFECDARPGEYVVQVSAPGFHEQRRRVTVVTDGVIVLNVDLQRARP
ncbi:MAG: carboxypeptidase regulatory-like domain-containing protein, partial [Deltaproteobacteria bacterium]